MKKKIIALTLAAAMALSLIACGSNDTSATAPTDSATTAPNTASDGKIGGKLVLYTSQTDADIEVVVNGFEEKYGVDVEVINGTAGDNMARAQAEKDNPQADVVWGGLNQSDLDKYADYFESYVSVNDADMLEGAANDNGMYSYFNFMVVNLVINTDICDELGVEINGYADLLQPELKGKIICADPTSSSSAWRHLTTILEVMGGLESEEAWDYVRQLMENMDGVITNSSSSCYKTVADGEYAVGLSYEDADLQLLLDGAQNIKVVYMEEGTTACGFAGAIIKNCKNMEAAKAFMDFITDPDLQSERANILGCMRPTNSKAEYESEFMPKTDEVKWYIEDYEYLGSHKSEILDKWTELWAEVNS